MMRVIERIGRNNSIVCWGGESGFAAPIVEGLDYSTVKLKESVLVFKDNGSINFVMKFINESATSLVSRYSIGDTIQ